MKRNRERSVEVKVEGGGEVGLRGLEAEVERERGLEAGVWSQICA